MIRFVKGRLPSAAKALAALLAVGGGMASTHPAFATDSKTDANLTRVLKTVQPRSKGWTSVIVQITPGTSATQAQKAITQLGGDVFRHLDIIQSLAVRVPTKNLQKLADLACVSHLSADVQTKKSDDFTVKHTGADVVAAPTWQGGYGLSGSGITVAVLDSGIRSSHRDFNNSWWNSRIVEDINFTSSNQYDTNDALGHGTHVAGIIGGNGYSSTGGQYFHTFTGVAPAANLINVRVLDSQGSGNVSNVIAGINWVVLNKSTYKIRVLNVSLGHPVYESYKTDPLNKAVEAAWQAGIVVVCAAGNNGRTGDDAKAYPGDNEGFGTQYGTIQCPGNDPMVITVGAMKNMDGNKAHDKVATYSSRGPSRIDMVIKPDIMAPGNRVVSTCADGSTLDNAFGNSNDIKMSAYQYGGSSTTYSETYFQLSGTSMAAPVVSGAAALLLSRDASLSPDTIKARLMRGADKLVNPNGTPDVLTYGAGYLNIPAALGNTAVVPQGTYAVSPKLKVNSNGTMSVFMDQILWGKADPTWSIDVGSLQVLWGKGAVDTAGDPVATSVTWAKASNVQADQVIWGKADASSVDISSRSVNGE